jgi:hypothetical protein
MSLTGPDYFQPKLGAVMITAVGEECFVCETPITRDPAWVWSGTSGEIWAHLGCAADLMVRIGYDLTLSQQKTGRRFHEVDKR